MICASVAAEHGDVAGLVAAARREELALLQALRLGRRHARLLQRVRSSLRGEKSNDIGQLLGLQDEELVTGLSGLPRRWRTAWR
ncbi:hypothetical protein ABIB85_007916 [Bradyrhizobium sp. JR1.5]